MSNWEKLNNLYVNKHLKIIPIVENSKIPAISKWNTDCSSDMMQILYWYENNHNFNWGLPCLENNLFVIDLDIHDETKNGMENFNKLCHDLYISVPETLIQRTQSGGIHYIFKNDEELAKVDGLANAFEDYPGIDLRNRNYILVEPSTINNKEYRFLNKLEPQEMPQELKQYILDNVGTKEDRKKSQYTKPKEVPVGNRDDAIFLYINNLYQKTNLDYDEILALAKYFNEEILEEPFSEKTVEYKVKKAFEKSRAECILIRLGCDEN